MSHNPYRRPNRAPTAVGVVVGVYAIVAFIAWLIVVGAIVAIAGDVIGLWNAVSFV